MVFYIGIVMMPSTIIRPQDFRLRVLQFSLSLFMSLLMLDSFNYMDVKELNKVGFITNIPLYYVLFVMLLNGSILFIEFYRLNKSNKNQILSVLFLIAIQIITMGYQYDALDYLFTITIIPLMYYFVYVLILVEHKFTTITWSNFKAKYVENTADPIIIYPYNKKWPEIYNKEAKKIISKCILYDPKLSVEHIGSTAIPQMSSKNIVDILIGVSSMDIADKLIDTIKLMGYKYISSYENQFPDRRYFEKSNNDTEQFHIHMVKLNSTFWNEHIWFRDFLKNHRHLADEYEKLKFKLAEKYRYNRDLYTKEKGLFIRQIFKNYYQKELM